jgi:hypothetical protein
MTRRRLVRVVLTLALTGACLTYILWQLDVGRTVDILVDAHVGWFLGALAVMLGGVPPMAYRWQKLLQARGIRDSLGWLNRAQTGEDDHRDGGCERQPVEHEQRVGVPADVAEQRPDREETDDRCGKHPHDEGPARSGRQTFQRNVLHALEHGRAEDDRDQQ